MLHARLALTGLVGSQLVCYLLWSVTVSDGVTACLCLGVF